MQDITYNVDQYGCYIFTFNYYGMSIKYYLNENVTNKTWKDYIDTLNKNEKFIIHAGDEDFIEITFPEEWKKTYISKIEEIMNSNFP